MDQGDQEDHGAGYWTRSTVVTLLHFANVSQLGTRSDGSKEVSKEKYYPIENYDNKRGTRKMVKSVGY